MGKIHVGWAKSVYGKLGGIAEWLMKQQLEKVPEGFKAIKEQIQSWASTAKDSLSSLSDLSKFLDWNAFKSGLVQLFEMSELIKSTFFALSSSLMALMNYSLTPPSAEEGREDNKQAKENESMIENLKTAFSSGFLKAGFDTVWDNFDIVKKLDQSSLSFLFKKALEKKEKFAERVNSLKSLSSESKSQWGKYSSESAFLNDLFDNSLINFILEPFNFFFSSITTCGNGKCKDNSNAFAETVQRFLEILNSSESKK